MMLLRTLRLDASDDFIFTVAAKAGEWAVSGAFLFDTCDPASLDGKQKAALRAGFLGVDSFGFSTLVEAAEATPADIESASRTLARHFVERLGAPDLETALPAARAEIIGSQSLANLPSGTVVALQRSLDANGDVRERFRILRQREAAQVPFADMLHAQSRAFEFFETDEDESVDLTALIRGEGG